MNRRILLVLCAAALFLPAAWAKPNFSGSWSLNKDKSDFGPMPGPDKMVRTIKHDDPNLKMTTTQSGPQGEATTEMTYTTDGKPSTNKTPRGEVTGTAAWDGDVLTINSKRQFNEMEITQSERWTLAEDGKSLVIVNKIGTPQGEFEVKIVLDKQ